MPRSTVPSATLSLVFRVLVVATFASTISARSASAQATDIPRPSIVAQLTLAASSAQSSVQSNQPAVDRLNWDTRVEHAHGRRTMGMVFLIGAGAGAVIGATIIGESGTAIQAAGTFTLIGSGIVGVIGAVKFSGGRRDLADLQREGKVRGYITVAPLPRGAMASGTFSF